MLHQDKSASSEERILARKVARELTDVELRGIAGSGSTGPFSTWFPPKSDGGPGSTSDWDTSQR